MEKQEGKELKKRAAVKGKARTKGEARIFLPVQPGLDARQGGETFQIIC